MNVFVRSQFNDPLMPTTPRKARVLLKEKKASVVQRNPFTIKLLYPSGNAKQEIVLGIDSGYLNIGFSAVTKKEELLAGEVQLLTGMKERNEERRSYRRTRRGRVWHRRKGFNVNTNRPGWLAPSIRHKIDSHVRFIDKLAEILPISQIVVETAKFDIQKIKNPEIQGKEYQEGEQKGFDNLRAYVMYRDGYMCQNPYCKNRDENQILVVHHIIRRSDGGSNRPDNLITLCAQCHTPENHNGFLATWKPKMKGFKEETYMSTVRWMIANNLKQKYDVGVTFGYLTNKKRRKLKLKKSHVNDAFCIARAENQIRHESFEIVQVRRNNRSLSLFYDAKYIDSRDGSVKSGKELNCGRTRRNKNLNTENLRKYRSQRAVNKNGKPIKGRFNIRKSYYPLQPMDLVEYEGQLKYISGCQNLGTRVLFKNSKATASVKKVRLIKYGKGFCWIDQKLKDKSL